MKLVIDTLHVDNYKISKCSQSQITTPAFILSKNSKFENIFGSMVGSFGGYTDTPAAVTGEHVLIESMFTVTGTKLSSVNPTVGGNLQYINDCSNSEIIPPVLFGAPCVNYLYFPKDTIQFAHTHPSFRVGFVLFGHGYATINDTKLSLNEGDCFFLPKETIHAFSTEEVPMSLIVFHPDSESGPTDHSNTMRINTHLTI